MLKYRLIFGALMIVLFTGVVVFDGWLDGSLTGHGRGPVGVLTAVLIAIVVIPAQIEITCLAARTGHNNFMLISLPASILLATTWLWMQLAGIYGHEMNSGIYVSMVCGLSVAAVFLYQAMKLGTAGVTGNCGASIFSILYLGMLMSFVLAIRVQFGALSLLMFVFTVKIADIGAYATGRLIGKHKFAPLISPGKTWEGIGGAVVFSGVFASIFAAASGIMSVVAAAIFGGIFAFIGQLGDLCESMLKRDATSKDSASTVPGFGGILDVIDSPLIAAPLAYIFMWAVLSLK
jgi:phosphatidate cytidylyltransferase